MVLGHTQCGAIAGAKAGVKDGHITGLLERIEPSISKSYLYENTKHEHDDAVAYANVETSLEEILSKSDIVREMFVQGSIGILGGIYNVDTGKVDFFKNLNGIKK
jgi:carbonic anhydrase